MYLGQSALSFAALCVTQICAKQCLFAFLKIVIEKDWNTCTVNGYRPI